MSRERFQKAKQIYNSALDYEPSQREAYLSEACGGDEWLRKEVESLLSCGTEAQEFFKVPAMHAGAKALAKESRVDFTGRTVSHYAIVEKIGEGGMGVVYRARDTHLGRYVALKVLPSVKVADPERRWRFVQEAKAASALNHPGIITIHDIDTADGMDFIAMEYVRGKTLDRMIQGNAVPLNELLSWCIQIAGALAALHSAGIIHRDIKPANIMIADTGLVKVLDFGLAKLSEPEEGAEIETSRPTNQKTAAGVILGTAAYMSPEQARGKMVDARSDIFSFGAVLYEMMTGRRAFEGETNASTVAAILREEPRPLSQTPVKIPHELEKIISRCLRKNPAERYQCMTDIKGAFEELKEKAESGVLASGARSMPRSRRRLAWTAVAFLLAALLGLGYRYQLLWRPASVPTAMVSVFTALPGIQTHPSFSPDGKQLAFLWNGEKQNNYDIYVQRVGDTAPRRLTSNPAFEYSPVWSPDGLHIAFLREASNGTEVIVIPAAGGTERRLHVSAAVCKDALPDLARQFCGLAWSPNGKFLSIVDRESPEAPNSIFLLDVATRKKRNLTMPPRGYEDGLSAFSPDGRSLAFSRGHRYLCDIYVLQLSESEESRAEPRRITKDNSILVGFDWTADSRGIVFCSQRGGLWMLWRVAASGGRPERLSVSGTNAFWPSVSREGAQLAYSEGISDSNIWRMAVRDGHITDAAIPMRISVSPQLDQQPTISPDGTRIAWASTHSGSHQIWVCRIDGSQPNRLTTFDPPGASEPQWSPDSRQIAFLGFSNGPTHVYVIDAKGGAPHRLTQDSFIEGWTNTPTWSRDGRWVYFVSNRGGIRAVWKVPAHGGSSVMVAPRGSWPVESVDGKFLYYSGPDANIWKVPAGGGSPELIARQAWPPFFESVDGRFVYYSGPDSSIWKIQVAGGEEVPILKAGERARWAVAAAGIYVLDPDAKDGPILEFLPLESRHAEAVRLPGEADGYAEGVGSLSISPDGRWMVYPRRDRNDAQIMLVQNFR